MGAHQRQFISWANRVCEIQRGKRKTAALHGRRQRRKNDARSWFAGNKPLVESTAFRNSSLQGAYFIITARSLGLDCGPMSGFDNAKVDAAFFQGTTWKSNFVCNLGHGDPSKLYPRAPRLDFNEACKIL